MNVAQKEQPTVARTFRAAIRIGEDFYTVEETITLPIDASDDEIAQAVDAGMRIYAAQRTAAEEQIRELRTQVAASPLPVQIRDPEAPASDKQRAYMDYLLNELGWDTDRLHTVAQEHRVDLVRMNKREASELIDNLKSVLEGRGSIQDTSEAPAEAPADAPRTDTRQGVLPVGDGATTRQIKALERLVEERGIDAEAELETRFDGRSFDQLSIDEAGQLLTEWQQRPRAGRAARRAA
jgi:hypothetical protein